MRDDDIDDTVVRRPRASLSGDRVSDALDDTVIRPVPTSTEQVDGPDTDDTVVAPSVPPRPEGDSLDDTVVRPVNPATERPGTVVGAEPGLPSVPSVPTTRVPRTRVPSIRIGERVLRLDRPVIIGRRPALPRILRGPVPELVTVPSGSGQVSSSHLLVHAEGEAAVVDDLRSTNGTVVRPPGAAPFRMPAGASNVVLTGTVVEIGDGNVIEVLSPHLRVAPATEDLPPLPPWPTEPPTGTPRTPRERS